MTPLVNTPAVRKYLLVKRKQGNFKKMSPFLKEESVTACAGAVDPDIRKTAGDLLMETPTD